MHLRRAVALACAAAVVTGGAAVASPAAIAAAPKPVTASQFSDIVLDSAHQHLFVAAAQSWADSTKHGGLFVTDLAGGNVQRVSGLTDIRDITLSPDGGTLYAVTATGFAAVNTSTLAATVTSTAATAPCPHSLAAVGSLLWFSFGCPSSGVDTVDDPGIASFDPGTGTITATSDPLGYGWSTLARVPGHDDELLVGQEDARDGGDLFLETISGTTLTVARTLDLSGVGPLAVTPDGSHVVLLGGGESHTYSLTDFSDTGPTYQFNAQGYPSAIAMSASGNHLALSSRTYDEIVHTYKADTGALVRSYVTPWSSSCCPITEPANNGLVWEGNTLVVVRVNSYTQYPSIYRYANATNPPTTIKLSVPKTGQRGAALTVSGRLTSNGVPLAGDSMTVRRTDLDGTHALPAVVSGVDGRFTITDHPPVGGTNIYTVSYAGDGTLTNSTGSAKVVIARATTALSARINKSIYSYGATEKLSVHLGRTFDPQMRTVSVYAKERGRRSVLVRRTGVDRSGDVTVRTSLTRNFKFIVVYAGDERFAPRTVTVSGRVRVRIREVVAGSYASHGGYHWFHASKGGAMAVKLSPNKYDRPVLFRLQTLSDGTWRTVDRAIEYLNKNSVVGVAFGGRPYTPLRIRCEYRADEINAGQNGAWWYVQFT